jgi:hypothetical protein
MVRALCAALGPALAAARTAAEPFAPVPVTPAMLARLVAAYPDHLAAIEDGRLVWRDGTRMALAEGTAPATLEAWLARPRVADMLSIPYDPAAPLPPHQDPGRARNAAFFEKMYGSCRAGTVAPNLVEVAWLPRRGGGRLRVTRINGVAERLARISAELDALPRRFDAFLAPAAGAYACRPIAGTERLSAHGYGIAVDIAPARAHYWRWTGGAKGVPAWRNAIPPEIVAVFERHGFIWGGRWRHYDTMHFEYRPELLAPVR